MSCLSLIAWIDAGNPSLHNQSINQSSNQPVNQPINQPINQSISQPINQPLTSFASINQSINESFTLSVEKIHAAMILALSRQTSRIFMGHSVHTASTIGMFARRSFSINEIFLIEDPILFASNDRQRCGHCSIPLSSINQSVNQSMVKKRWPFPHLFQHQ